MITKNRLISDLPDIHTFWLSFVIVGAIFSIALLTITPVFQTNDDIAMSMNVHGYGNILGASPNLIFSNIYWGHIVRLLPELFNIPGYSLATLVVLFIASWSILYYLLKLGTGILIATFSIATTFSIAILTPQFTINAGLITVSAVLGLLWYARCKKTHSLLFPLIFALIGFLIRSKEFVYVLLVFAPVFVEEIFHISTRVRFKQLLVAYRPLLIAIVIFSLLSCLVSYVDQKSYDLPEWNQFMSLNAARLPFTDYGVWQHLTLRKDIIEKYAFSENDLLLIANWFFSDKSIADPQLLNQMYSEVGPQNKWLSNLTKVPTGVKMLLNWPLLPILLVGVTSYVLVAGKRVSLTAAWVVFFSSVVALGLLGRPGGSRIYFPVISLLVFLSLLRYQEIAEWRKILLLTVILFGFVFTWNKVQVENQISEERIRLVSQDVAKIQSENYIAAWGASFPVQYYYPLLSNVHEKSFPLYQLGVNTYNPYSIAYHQETKGEGFVHRLLSDDGLTVIAHPGLIEILRTYCSERHNGLLHEDHHENITSFYMYTVRCDDLN